jgi:hypothetical protein
MNSFAQRVLPVAEKQPFDKMVLAFHPDRSRPKVKFMLDQAATCPVANPPPMTMIINIPERVLLIKVTKMFDGAGGDAGYVLVFYDITEAVVTPAGVSPPVPTSSPAPKPLSHSAASGSAARKAPSAPPDNPHRQLSKIPAVSQNRIVLVDADTVQSIRSEGHYTRIRAAQGSYFCNLNIGDLELRLDPGHFLRVHRSHIANLRFATQIVRDEGRVLLGMTGSDEPIPVARAQVARLMQRLGLPG